MDTILDFYEKVFYSDDIIYGIWSNPRKKSQPISKITCKPVTIKAQRYLQFSSLHDKKESHTNILPNNLVSYLAGWQTDFKQLQLFTVQADYQVLINKKGDVTVKKNLPSKKAPIETTHNRTKNYLLDATNASDFLIALGIMDGQKNIKPTKYNKYKQINKYLEMVTPVVPYLGEGTLRIVDFGCGKSYLTFALYYYFTFILKRDVHVVGLDLKEDVIKDCQAISSRLGYAQLHFQVGDIGHYTTDQVIDMVVSLHACNTATDLAISKAIQWQAKAILAVPCCHHECYTQIQNALLAPIFQHGILKEKIAALLTDGLRAQLLTEVGYKVQVIEFIDTAHTPKNILIRAVASSLTPQPQAKASYDDICKFFNLHLTLDQLLHSN